MTCIFWYTCIFGKFKKLSAMILTLFFLPYSLLSLWGSNYMNFESFALTASSWSSVRYFSVFLERKFFLSVVYFQWMLLIHPQVHSVISIQLLGPFDKFSFFLYFSFIISTFKITSISFICFQGICNYCWSLTYEMPWRSLLVSVNTFFFILYISWFWLMGKFYHVLYIFSVMLGVSGSCVYLSF